MVNLGAAKTPEGMRLYSIGDVHGLREELGEVLARIDADLARRPVPDHRIILVGDYVDRGPDSRGVLDDLIARKAHDSRLVCLRGNHDQAFLVFLKGHSVPATTNWLTWGGRETLGSYGVASVDPRDVEFETHAEMRRRAKATIPPEHAEFLDQLLYSVQFGDYFFAHAGVRPGVPLDQQDHEDLMWVRDAFIPDHTHHGAMIVHGHTPSPEGIDIRPNRICVDTKAYETGNLSCLVLEGTARRALTEDGLQPL